MPSDDALSGLPPVYQEVLEHLDAGWSHDDIARQVGIDPSAVEPLIRLAKAKLVRAQHTSVDAPDGINLETQPADLERET